MANPHYVKVLGYGWRVPCRVNACKKHFKTKAEMKHHVKTEHGY